MQTINTASLGHLFEAGYQVMFKLVPEKQIDRIHGAQVHPLCGHPYQPYVAGENELVMTTIYAPGVLAAAALWEMYENQVEH